MRLKNNIIVPIILFVILGFNIQSISVIAQNYTLSGYVADSLSGETIIGVTVALDGTSKSTVTDSKGFYRLSGVKAGNNRLFFSHITYKSTSISVRVSNDLLLKEILLEEDKISIKEIAIVGVGNKRLGDREVETSLIGLSLKAIKTIPGAGGDVFKAIKYLPGIEGGSPFSPLVSVRGGDPSENLISLDGVTIYNPYHVVSSAGAFNTNSIKDVEIMLGGFGAEYGGRNSSIINIVTKEGSNKGFHGEFEPSSNNFTGYCEFPVSENSKMTLAGRFFYPIISNFALYSNNWFYDFNLSYVYKINERNKISMKYFTSRDNQDFSIKEIYQYIGNMISDEDVSQVFNNFDISKTNKWKNNAVTLICQSIITPRLIFDSQVYGSFHSSENASGFSFKIHINDSFPDIKYEANTRFSSSIDDICFKSSLNWKPTEWNSIKFGFEANNYKFSNSASISNFEKGQENRKPLLFAFFVEDKLKLGSLIVRPGVRMSRYSLTDNYYIEPRVNAVLNLSWNWELKAAWGQYYQYITSMNTSEYEFSQMLDYYYPLQNLKPASSEHFIVGFGKKLNQSLSVSFDAYKKNIKRIYTFNLTQSEIEAYSFADKLQQGHGEANGIEILTKGQYQKLSGWTSLGIGRTTRSYPQYMNGKDFLSDYDKTFTFKGVCNYQLSENLSYSAGWLVLSGRPITISTTSQQYFSYDPNANNLAMSPQYVTREKNNARLTMVIQLDIGFKKQLREGFGAKLKNWLHAKESYVTGSLQNLTFFRRNIDFYMYEPSSNYYLPIGVMNLYPVAVIGYSIKF